MEWTYFKKQVDPSTIWWRAQDVVISPSWLRHSFFPSYQECWLLIPQSVPLWELSSVRGASWSWFTAPPLGKLTSSTCSMKGDKAQHFLQCGTTRMAIPEPELPVRSPEAFTTTVSQVSFSLHLSLPTLLPSGVILSEKAHLSKLPAQKSVSESFSRNST